MMAQHRQPLSEFSLIDTFFAGLCTAHPLVDLAVGDDCALLAVPPGQRLAISVDTVVAGRHFPEDAAPADIAYRALAVAASDLAAMAATPLAATLALTLPTAEHDWLAAFSDGLRQALADYELVLVGGDTTRGPLAITVQVHGLVAEGRALLRSGARVGDQVLVSGSLGDAGAALAVFAGHLAATPAQQRYLHQRFYRPSPRLQLASRLASVASSAIDISDGLLADLGHIAERSGVAAVIEGGAVPLSDCLQQVADHERALQWALTAGDDYELCFTVPRERMPELTAIAAASGVGLTRVGEVIAGRGVRAVDGHGNPLPFAASGFQHFTAD